MRGPSLPVFLTAFLTTLFFLAVGSAILLAQPDRSGYELNWQDDFSGNSVNTGLWTVADTNVPTNNSLQDYLPSQVTVEAGNLVITSENVASRGLPYRSGLVTSTALQKHGRWEVRAKLPTSRGMWPAIWLLGDTPNWPSLGEIDIMENRGDEPTMTSSAFHWGTNPPYSHSFIAHEQKSRHNGQLVNYHNSFHDYAVEWDPKQIRFYVDDVHHATVRDSDVGGFLSNNVGNMRLIINTAVGGDFLDNPDSTTVWPQRFEIDHVYAYTRLAEGPTLTFENGGFEARGGSLAGWTTFGNDIPNVGSGQEYTSSGSESLKLFGRFNGETNYSGVEQGISVTAGDELWASAEAYVSSLDTLVGTDNELFLKIDYYSENYGLFDSDNYLGSDSLLLADGTTSEDQWSEMSLSSTAPANAVEARLALVFTQRNNAGGSVFVDNVQFLNLTAIPEPSGLGVLGLFSWGLLRRRRMDCEPA